MMPLRVAEVDMAGRVDEVEPEEQPVTGGVLQANGAGLDYRRYPGR
jgi:hypothetical protein